MYGLATWTQMAFATYLSYLFLLAMFAGAQAAKEGPCFQFNGDSYLHFTPNNFNNNNSIHYTFKFRTTQENGILMYSRGAQGDDEALFLKGGKLRYHLFNTSPVGIDGYFGAYLQGDEQVNTDQWITVQVYRSWSQHDRTQRRTMKKTGFEVEINGTLFSHVDYLERSDISILPVIYFGGYKESLAYMSKATERCGITARNWWWGMSAVDSGLYLDYSVLRQSIFTDTRSTPISQLHNFNGQIMDISEEKNGRTFENPSLNYKSLVQLSCLEGVQPN